MMSEFRYKDLVDNDSFKMINPNIDTSFNTELDT